MPHPARLLCGVFAFALAVVSSVAATAATAKRYDKAAFSRALATGAPVGVHVCAGWSPLCQTQKPIVGALLKEPEMRSVQLLNADFDTDLEARRTLRVLHQGTLIVFRNGREVSRSSGDTDRTAIAALLSGDSGRMTTAPMAGRAGGIPYEKDSFDRAVAAGGPVVQRVDDRLLRLAGRAPVGADVQHHRFAACHRAVEGLLLVGRAAASAGHRRRGHAAAIAAQQRRNRRAIGVAA